MTGDDGTPLTIELPIYKSRVIAHIWRVEVGRVPLFLLDTDISVNGPLERWITARLYEADPTTRLAQYVLLGAGGIRALSALGIEPGVIHLNEGHAALAPLSLAAALRNGDAPERALAAARDRTVFTTHTPVAGGQRRLSRGRRSTRRSTRWRVSSSIPASDVIALGRSDPADDRQPFGVTQAALRMSRAANAVSRRHGEVARRMWAPLWPDRPEEEVPIRYVTNGVHVPTWIGRPDAGAARSVPRRGLAAARRRPAAVGGRRRHTRGRAVGRAGAPARARSSSSYVLAAPRTGCCEGMRASTPRPRRACSIPGC